MSIIIDIMSFLETKLTNDYMKFGHCLGLDMNKLHTINTKMGHDARRCIREIMFQWRRGSPNATPKIIIEALKTAGYHILSKMANDRVDASNFCSMCQKNHGIALDSLTSLTELLSSDQSKLQLYD